MGEYEPTQSESGNSSARTLVETIDVITEDLIHVLASELAEATMAGDRHRLLVVVDPEDEHAMVEPAEGNDPGGHPYVLPSDLVEPVTAGGSGSDDGDLVVVDEVALLDPETREPSDVVEVNLV